MSRERHVRRVRWKKALFKASVKETVESEAPLRDAAVTPKANPRLRNELLVLFAPAQTGAVSAALPVHLWDSPPQIAVFSPP